MQSHLAVCHQSSVLIRCNSKMFFALQTACQMFSQMHLHFFFIHVLLVRQAHFTVVHQDVLERSLPVSCNWLHMELSAGRGWRGRQVFLGSGSSRPWPSGMEAFCTNSTNSYKTNRLTVLRQPNTKPVNCCGSVAWCANITLPQVWNQVHQKAWSRPWKV